MAYRKEVMINLLPIDQESIQNRRLAWGGALITVVLVAVILLINCHQENQIVRVQSEQTKLQKQLVNYKKQEAAEKQKKDLVQLLKQRKAEVKSAELTGLPASTILQEVERSVPRSVKLTDIQFDRSKLMINGFSPDQKEIAVLLSGLRKNSRFSQVTVTASKAIEENGEIEFVIESEWRGGR
ncbi:MAG: PilN domain-containing protein [Methylocystaceae bacterium]